MHSVVHQASPGYICSRCLSTLFRRSPRQAQKNFRTNFSPGRTLPERDYFHANGHFTTTTKKASTIPLEWFRSAITPGFVKKNLQLSKLLCFEQNAVSSKLKQSLDDGFQSPRPQGGGSDTIRHQHTNVTTPVLSSEDIPLDASSQLSTLSARSPSRSLRRALSAYLSLSKPRLSFLIVLTTTAAYSLYPVPTLLLPTTTTSPSLSTLTLLFLTTGTALSCASANALNMLFEPEFDAKMSRTRNRPLVRKLLTARAATVFAAVTGAAGLGLLLYGVNSTVASLSALNILLYAGVYTPMKRISVVNTWIGAVVGGIPPLMGWTAAAGQRAKTHEDWRGLLFGDGSAGGWVLAALLFAWQFPHFNALSWTIREEYRNAGHRMLAWTNPRANARIALRYALLLFPICAALHYWAGVTDRGFLVTSSLVNAWMVREAWRFWRFQGSKGSARGLFWASVWHLPVVLVLAMAHKKGLWDGVWVSLMGDDRLQEYDEDEEVDDGVWKDEREMVQVVSS
ncbi:MAG: Protoheme IX farnesyltransferase, mitochondrial [Peltula sp. TS41687]|nr:MAG: Protoheme IX farnesyltransferase, mitochondrial [Peltula sp. TS41687]